MKKANYCDRIINGDYTMTMNPIVKWAGGKRQVMEELKKHLPENFNNYYEPFIGGGALLFELAPNHAIINDVNHELISIYQCLKDAELCTLMTKELDIHKENHSEDYYYKIREMDRNPRYELEPIYIKAARAIYLNKAGWNGLYRVNLKGYFNVPSGKKIKEKLNLYDKDNIENIHKYFDETNIEILSLDFTEATRTAREGDFVYFDPPYDTWEDKESFTAYSKFDFNKDDQRRLSECFKDLTRRGVKCMLSNHNTAKLT